MARAGMILGAAIALMATQATAGGMKVEPGAWEFQSTSTTPMAATPQSEITRECVKEDEISPEIFMEDASGCTLTDSKSNASMMKWKMTCPNPGGEMTGEAEFSSTGETIRGSMKMAMTINGQPMNFEMEWKGRRIGPCE